MGRQAAAPHLRILNGRGNDRKGRQRDSGGRVITPPPNFKRIAPEKPSTLSEHAAAHWDEIVPGLQRLSLLTPGQVGSLVIMCEAYAVCVEALADIKKRGVMVKSKRGLTRNPALMAFSAASKEYRGGAIQFGLTPSAEGRLKTPEPDGGEDNPFE